MPADIAEQLANLTIRDALSREESPIGAPWGEYEADANEGEPGDVVNAGYRATITFAEGTEAAVRDDFGGADSGQRAWAVRINARHGLAERRHFLYGGVQGTGGGFGGYRVELEETADDIYTVRLYRRSSGAWEELALATEVEIPQETGWVALSIFDGELKVWRRKTEEEEYEAIVETEDAEPHEGQYGGVGEQGNIGRLQDFSSGELTAAPTVTTSAATGITPTKATLNGTVDPNGLATDYWFPVWRDDWQTSGAASRTNEAPDPISTREDWALHDPLWHPDNAAVSHVTAAEAGFGWAGAADEGALKIELSGSTGGVWNNTNRWPLTDEVERTFSVYVRHESAETVRTRLRVEFINEANEVLAEHQDAQSVVPNTTQRLIVTATPPEGTVEVRFRASPVYLDGTEGDVGYISRFLIERAAEADDFIPRAHELTSGQAVEEGEGLGTTWLAATPTLVPAEAVSVGEGTEPVSVSEEATGLSAGVEYHARLYAENADGEAWGEDVTFTTPVGTVRRVRSPRRSIAGRV